MRFLSLPEHVRTGRRERGDQPYVDYSKSIILTTDDYLNLMADKSAKKVAATEERERRRAEAKSSKRRREESKVQAEVEKVRCRHERAAKKAFDALWTPSACASAGQRLHDRIRNSAPHPESIRVLQLCALCAPVWRQNMKIAVERRRRRRAGLPTCDLSPLTEPLCAHQSGAVTRTTT